ncbi:tumor necrosis factor receptor superfamily member 18 [Gracilinanus agilis]|uniref:tumor necrosis factor receptor superfamily member 18 n=1 Tax=Gracilinanus agilis TaxID=191870 RepID=UPI001CFCE9A3|nr:tumor necrosis factor receptor superfamily member 18 [Gracilinanus agilis]
MVVGTFWIMGTWWGVLLLCPRGQGLDPSPSVRCGPGQTLHHDDSVWRCCSSQCNSSTKACPPHQLKDCTCAIPGEYCTKSECKDCKKHPCSPGQQVHIRGFFSSYSVPMAILTGLTIVITLIVFVHLVLHIWPVKGEPSTKDREPILPLGPGPPDDIGNCPFPEEEWGEKTAEDKVQMGHPWV